MRQPIVVNRISMKDQLFGQIDLARLFDGSIGQAQLDSLNLRGTDTAHDGNATCSVIGTPHFEDNESASEALKSGMAAGFLKTWRKYGTGAASHVRGAYAMVIADAVRKSVFLAVDRFAIQTLCYCLDGQKLSFSDRADCVEGTRRTNSIRRPYSTTSFST